MRNAVEVTPVLSLAQVRGGSVACFPDAAYWNNFGEDTRGEALATTLSLTAEKLEEASMSSVPVEELSPTSISDWEVEVALLDDGSVEVSRFAGTRAFLQKWEAAVLSVSGSLFTLSVVGVLPQPF